MTAPRPVGSGAAREGGVPPADVPVGGLGAASGTSGHPETADTVLCSFTLPMSADAFGHLDRWLNRAYGKGTAKAADIRPWSHGRDGFDVLVPARPEAAS